MFFPVGVVFGAKFAPFNGSVGSADEKKNLLRFSRAIRVWQLIWKIAKGFLKVCLRKMPGKLFLSRRFSRNSFTNSFEAALATTNRFTLTFHPAQDTRRKPRDENLRDFRSVAHRISHPKVISPVFSSPGLLWIITFHLFAFSDVLLFCRPVPSVVEQA